MLTLIFILSLTLASLAFLLMALTLQFKLPLFSVKKEIEETISIPTVSRKKLYETIDLGILKSRRNNMNRNSQPDSYSIPLYKTELLLEYKQISKS